MKLKQLRTLISVLVLISVFTACDERNEVNLPDVPYRLVETYSTPGIAAWVDAEGDRAAIAMSSAGMRVLDVSDVINIETVFEFQPSPGSRVTRIVLDPVAHLVMPEVEGNDEAYGILDYTRPADSARIGGAAFSGPLNDVAISHDPLSLTIWGSDDTASDGLVATHYCRESDTSEWVFGCDFFWQGYVAPSGTVAGFDLSDSVFAVAADWAGVHFHNSDPPQSISDIETPGIAGDCAWFGDYVIVADQYYMTVIDAANVDSPRVITQFSIDGADRLAQVKVDVTAQLAVLLDTNDGLYIVDISDPFVPELVQDISFPEPTSLDVSGNRLYVTDEARGLLIFER